jgi:hypothetical protein
MLVPIVAIPPSIEIGLAPYRDLFPRLETYQHIKEYCTGLVVLEKPSINRLAACLVDGPAQSSINKALNQQGADAVAVVRGGGQSAAVGENPEASSGEGAAHWDY